MMENLGKFEEESSDRDKLNTEKAEELDGSLDSNPDDDDKLMRSVIEDDSAGEDGKLVEDAVNRGMGAFIPDMMFSQITKNYKQAEQMYGEKIIREVTDYSPDFIEKNSKVPEFQRELKSKIGQRIKNLKDKGLLDNDGFIQDKGFKLASLVMYTEELDKLEAQGLLGDKKHKERSHYGGREDSDFYKKGDRYHDIDVRKTIKVAARRGHSTVQATDLKIFERESKGNVEIIYALDASGSMKGKKIEMCKKAGVALAYKAIENRDKVGVMVFGSDVKERVEPSTDFMKIVDTLARVFPSKETNFERTIEESFELFSKGNFSKHLIFITDGMPTTGDNPEEDALEAIAHAEAAGISCSFIGIQLQADGEQFLRKASEIGAGKFHNVKNLDNLDMIVLEDYEAQ